MALRRCVRAPSACAFLRTIQAGRSSGSICRPKHPPGHAATCVRAPRAGIHFSSATASTAEATSAAASSPTIAFIFITRPRKSALEHGCSLGWVMCFEQHALQAGQRTRPGFWCPLESSAIIVDEMYSKPADVHVSGPDMETETVVR